MRGPLLRHGELEGDDGEPATGEGVGRKVGLAVGATVGFRSTTVEEVYEATVTKERLSMAFVNDAEFNSVAIRPFQDSAVLYPVLAKDTEMPNSTYHFGLLRTIFSGNVSEQKVVNISIFSEFFSSNSPLF